MVQKQVSVRIVSQGGDKLKAEFAQIGQVGETSFGRVQRSSTAMGGSLQNAGFQVQDFFVQVAAGTSATQALAQQLPQLLGGMGLIGVLAGTAVAAIAVLGKGLLGARDDAAALEQTIRALDDAVSSLETANGRAAKGFNDLRATYGANAEAARQLFEIQREIAQMRADQAFGAASRDVAGAIGGGVVDFSAEQLRVNADLLQQAKTDYAEITAQIEAFGDINSAVAQAEWEALQQRKIGNDLAFRSLVEYRSELETIADTFGVSEQAASALAVAAAQVAEADTSADRLTAARALSEAIYEQTDGLRGASTEAMDLYDSLLDAVSAGLDLSALDIASGIRSGADEAARLADNLLNASRNYGRIQNTGQSGPDAARRAVLDLNAPGVVTGTLASGAGGAFVAPPSRSSGGGGRSGGGGGGGGGARQPDLTREAQRLYEQTRTEAEKFAAEQERINVLFQQGLIEADTYQRAIDMIGEKYRGAGESQDFFAGVTQDLKDAFLDAAVTGEASFERIGQAIKRAALEALIFGEGPLAKVFGGGLLGGLLGGRRSGTGILGLPSFDGGGFTGSRPRVGGMDGKGGFLAMLHPEETVLDHTRGHRAGGGASVNLTVSIDARGAQEGVAEQIDRKMAQALPELERRAVAAVARSRSRGALV